MLGPSVVVAALGWSRPRGPADMNGVHARGLNMNGHYSVATTRGQDAPYNDDYASKGHEYFDFYTSELATHYGEVFWTVLPPKGLPEEIVRRFANRTIAITGYEMDQVMVSPTGQPDVDPKADVSVPINWAYNHHYEFWLTGANGELVSMPADTDDYSSHGARSKYRLAEKESATPRADSSTPPGSWFSEGNGGESRKSYHGAPRPGPSPPPLLDRPLARAPQATPAATRSSSSRRRA